VPILVEVMHDALHSGDTSANRLDAFQRCRAGRVRYAQRISNRWAQLLSSPLPGVRLARDLGVRWLARDTSVVEKFYQELASPRVPALSTRLRVLLP
jgi:2-polyprenyl-6-methoxyphenol hydroxylase-like FAD-dependent oxidoreductase